MSDESRPKTDPAAPPRDGYRNPPAAHRFKPGQSGNPKGRPRKPKPEVRALDIAAILRDPVTVTTSKGLREMTPYETGLRRQVEQGIKQKQIKSLLAFLKQLEKAGLLPEAPPPVVASAIVYFRNGEDPQDWLAFRARHGRWPESGEVPVHRKPEKAPQKAKDPA